MTSPTIRSVSRSALFRIALLALALVIVIVLGYRLHWFDLQRITALVGDLRAGHNALTAGAIFIAASAAAIAIGFPALPFTVASGAIFGHLLGSALAWSGAVCGSLTGYLIARFVGRETTRRWLTRKTASAGITQATDFLTLLRIRLVPFVPLSVVNYAAGLARTRVRTFLAATALGIVPVTVLFAYFADRLVQGFHDAKADAYRGLALASGALILLSLVPTMLRWHKRPDA
jgi:uncharacterized membrane protein YdjX (TVP38/TMEM64 family)